MTEVDISGRKRNHSNVSEASTPSPTVLPKKQTKYTMAEHELAVALEQTANGVELVQPKNSGMDQIPDLSAEIQTLKTKVPESLPTENSSTHTLTLEDKVDKILKMTH